ncbi:MAG TPA: zinc ribbon domain-containing protein [Clostridiales bacterium]|nr:zinc ribbon domain-containing protein [Clostridiales bacterium]
MGFIEDTIVKAKEVFDIAGRKTGEVIEIQKLKVNAASLNHQIAKDYETLGRLWYDIHKANSGNTESLEVLCKEIEQKLEKLKKLEAKIALAKNGKLCVSCGHVNQSDAFFCSKCGKELTAVAAEEPEEAAAEE